jgi:hypothetical protein
MCEPSPSPGRITTGEVFTLHMHGYSQLHKLSERLHTKHLNAGRNPPLLQFSKLHRNHQIHWSPKPKPTRDPRSTDGGSQARHKCHTFHAHEHGCYRASPHSPTQYQITRLHTECYRNLSLLQLSKLHRNHQTHQPPTHTLADTQSAAGLIQA